MYFLWFSPSGGLGRSGCTVAPGAAGSQGSVAGSAEARVPVRGRWTALQGNGQTPASKHSHNPLPPSHLNQFKDTCLKILKWIKKLGCQCDNFYTYTVFIFVLIMHICEVEHMYMLVCMHTVVEVELCYGQQHSGKHQVRAEPTKERLNAWKRSVHQRGVLYTHTVQDTHCLHQALKEETGQTQ